MPDYFNILDTPPSLESFITATNDGDIIVWDSGSSTWVTGPDHSIVMLATPVTIVANASIVYTAWTTVDNAQLAALGAAYAYLSVTVHLEDDDDAESHIDGFFRTTGSGLAIDDTTRRVIATAHGHGGGMGGSDDEGCSCVQFLIQLDASQDFDYYMQRTGSPDATTAHIELIGYVL